MAHYTVIEVISMLEVRGLTKYYKDTKAVGNVSFHVGRGEVFALIGSNGAGKTTTIKIILGLIENYQGSVKTDGLIDIGYSPETPFFHPFLSGYEVMRFLGKLQKISKVDLEKQIDKILKMVGLEKFKRKKVSGYSKGMIQRLGIAQALLGNPDLLILDEPAAGLDSIGRIEVLKLIKSFKKRGKSIIINSHILNDVEQVADRGIILKEGEMVAHWEKRNSEDALENIFLKAVGGNYERNSL